MTPPFITVVTINFNNRDALRRTIGSVNAQTYPKIEHVLIDGGSDDDSLAVIKTHAHRAPRWLSEPDAGISDAFNKGTRLARGEYLCYLNAGDVFEGSDVVHRAVAEIGRTGHTEPPTIFYGDFLSVTGDDRRLHETSAALADFAWANPINHQSAFIPRSLAAAHPYDSRLTLGMDYDFWLRVYDWALFHKLPFPVAAFELGGRSSHPQWEVHGLVMHRVLWHLHHRSRFGVSDLAAIGVRTARFKLLYAVRRLLGPTLSLTLRRTKTRWLQGTAPTSPRYV